VKDAIVYVVDDGLTRYLRVLHDNEAFNFNLTLEAMLRLQEELAVCIRRATVPLLQS